MDPNWAGVREWVGNALLGVLGWLGIDIVRKFRGHGRRIAKLEADRVTRDDIDELRESIGQLMAQNHQRTEDRLERIWQHMASGD